MIKTKKQGFTILELMIVMGLLALAGGFCLFANVESLSDEMFKSDCDEVVGALRRARSLAVSGVCLGAACSGGAAHGVHFDPAKKEFVIFQGADYATRAAAVDEAIKFEDPAIYVDSSSTMDIVFELLSGNSGNQTIALKDERARVEKISINSFGQIDWR